jgi:hypothetical protein
LPDLKDSRKVRMAGISRPMSSSRTAGARKATSWIFSRPRLGALSTTSSRMPTTAKNATTP